jgi:hypothetical protein
LSDPISAEYIRRLFGSVKIRYNQRQSGFVFKKARLDKRAHTMNDCNTNDNQIVESAVIDEISDEDLEAAAGVPVGAVPTLLGTYCFTCPPLE